MNKALFDTPVLFLIFNRPDTTQKVFDQIKKIKPRFLFVAADGPREYVDGEKLITAQTRNIINQVDWDCELKTHFREKNLGCKYGVSTAISWFFDNVEEGIVLEDDCFPSLSFFEFCSQMLKKYRHDTRVSFIGGNYFQKERAEEWDTSYYFSNYAHIWGWASWRRVWKEYDVNMKDYNSKMFEEKFTGIFNSATEKRHWKKIFNLSSTGQLNTWDFQLAYTIWKKGGVSIIPVRNLVINLGLTGSSTHFFLEDSFRSGLTSDEMKFPLVHPSTIEVNRKADQYSFKNLYGRTFKRAFRLIKENNIGTIYKYIEQKVRSVNIF